MKFSEVVIVQRQQAIFRPCEHAIQCSDSRYFFTVYPAQRVTAGVCLTVNVGEE
jgi:hypothetical protein